MIFSTIVEFHLNNWFYKIFSNKNIKLAILSNFQTKYEFNMSFCLSLNISSFIFNFHTKKKYALKNQTKYKDFLLNQINPFPPIRRSLCICYPHPPCFLWWMSHLINISCKNQREKQNREWWIFPSEKN